MSSKPLAFLTILVALNHGSICSAATDLITLGESTLDIATDFTDLSYTQSGTTLILGGSFNAGQKLEADFLGAPYDWSSAPALALSLSSTNAPLVNLFVEFQTSAFATLAEFEVSAASAVSTPASVSMTLKSGSIANLTNVAALMLSWGGNSTETTPLTIHSIQSVPEPSTYALLALSGIALGTYMLRRHRSA
jgi:hypothetical protein